MTPKIDNAVRGELVALQYDRAEHPTAEQGARKLVLLCVDKEPPHELRKRWYDALLPRRGAVLWFVTSALASAWARWVDYPTSDALKRQGGVGMTF